MREAAMPARHDTLHIPGGVDARPAAAALGATPLSRVSAYHLARDSPATYGGTAHPSRCGAFCAAVLVVLLFDATPLRSAAPTAL